MTTSANPPSASSAQAGADSDGTTRNATEEANGSADRTESDLRFTIRQEFPNKLLFYGLSVTLEQSSDEFLLRSLRGVKRVTPVTFIQRPKPYANEVAVTPKPTEDQIEDKTGTLGMTGVRKLHAEGIEGKGVKIAVIDTGVDWTHPALGGCFGPGCKVSSGWDLVGDDYDGTNDPQPDRDPFSQCGPHGTHVAGIIVADDPRYSLRGVAPAAELSMYRVFGCEGGTADDMLMKGMERAYEDGADVLSISIGSPAGWTDTPTAKMASNVAAQGKAVSVAAGNDGSVGMFFPSGPAVGAGVISVGSIENAWFTVFNATVSPGDLNIPYYSVNSLKVPTLPIYATSFDKAATRDACDNLPEGTPDLSGYVVLVRRGGCGLETKFSKVAAAGGKYVLIYNNGLGPIYVEPSSGIVGASLIEARDGASLVDKLAEGTRITLSFPNTGPFSVPNKFNAGIVSPFSSYGPTFDLFSQTDISAPGGQILSIWPVNLGNYSILSGTSMAAPFIAGSAALMIQADRERLNSSKGTFAVSPNVDPSGGRGGKGGGGGVMDVSFSSQALDRLRATAIPAFNSTRSTLLETVAKQGSGLVQVDRAVHYTSQVSPSLLMLNDSSGLTRSRKFRLLNSSGSKVSYTLSHEAAGTAMTFPKKSTYENAGPVPLVSQHATVTIEPDYLTLEAGGEGTIDLTFVPPENLDPTSLPVYSGFVRVASSLNETLSVSYLGVAATMSDFKVLDEKSGMTKSYALPAVIVGNSGKVQRLPRTYSFVDGDVPVLQFRLVMGSKKVRVDLVETLTAPVDAGTPTALRPSQSHQKQDEKRNRRRFHLFHQERTRHRREDPWDGTVGGTGTVKDGEYKLLLRALKLGREENLEKEEDWETYLSPVITVARNEAKADVGGDRVV
ncbi:subtilisin-like protein [Violaceomyces palustris]|uniref:Subtilisin-like protein n=1 Tax=Violaceomyces palustris TaxID=1673888 RepID=A0ACD0P0D9_9BASI|nr:subtilisin-like protein [Violaceomyces palustris]